MIESSCDETAAAVVTGPRMPARLWCTRSSTASATAGSCPVASRAHILAIDSVAEAALAEAGMGWATSARSPSRRPGLKGSLLVGIEHAKGAAAALDVPLVPAHHLAGHLRAPWLRRARASRSRATPSSGWSSRAATRASIAAMGRTT